MTAAPQIAPVASEPKLELRQHARFATAIGVFTLCWYLALSTWFGLTPGSLLTKRNNVMFNSDSSAWIQRFSGEEKKIRAKPYIFIHPLEEVFWRPPARAIGHILKPFFPATPQGIDAADLLGAQLLVGIIFALGISSLALFALSNGVDKVKCAVLFTVYLLFTSMSTVILPEHFAISNALLTITFVLPVFLSSPRLRTAFLGMMTVLCGGTICTNFAFPLGMFVGYYPMAKRRKKMVVGIALAGAMALPFVLYFSSASIRWFIRVYSNVRIFHAPLRAVFYAMGMMIYPAVGSTPHVFLKPGWDDLTFEPWRLGDYAWIQLVAAAAWVTLLGASIIQARRDERMRPQMLAIFGWLVYEALLHNFWGDELLLYAPSWTWALMGLLILGAPYLSRKFLTLIAVPIVAGQIYTLIVIKSVMQTITH